MTFEENKKKIMNFVQKYSQKSGYHLNSNKEILELIIVGLTKQKEKYGFFYCPCKIVTGNIDVDKNIICPCKSHIEDIKKNGSCHCNLFYK